MNKQWLTVASGVVMVIAIGALWWRVENLESTVDTLRQQLSADSKFVTASQPRAENNPAKKQVVKLIDSPSNITQSKSKVGVPWSVERAMMPGENSQFAPSEGEWHWDVQVQPNLNTVPGTKEFTPLDLKDLGLPNQPDSK